jgi:hypothetical protein
MYARLPVIFLVGTLLPLASTAGAADLNIELVNLFVLGSSAKTRQVAQEQFEQLRSAHAGDARVYYAYALAAIKTKQYRPAAEAIDEVLDLQPQCLPARKAKIWLALVTGKPATAIPAMEQLAELLGNQPPSIAETLEYRQTAEFLGRICAYLAGPGQGSIELPSLAAAETQVFARLSNSQQASFLVGRQAVLMQFSALAQEIQSLSQQAANLQADVKNRKKAQLGSESQYVANERSQYEQRRAEVRRAGSEERGQILQTQQATLGAYSQACADASFASQDESAACTPAPMIKAAELGAGLAFQNLQYLDAMAREHQELNHLASQQKSLTHRMHRIAHDETQLAMRRLVGATPQMLSLKAKLMALGTYVAVPVMPEEEMQRVLSTFDTLAVSE